ncbi:integrase [Bifidobacterium sp. UTCIF-37]|uniref:tyrosine-type recombinase/integrase n=1 Tax=unclassified Bifidobacterium TaxID=2608897 RepID=UPI001126921F|nr:MULTISPECIES: site-specific integrase [unclassified Bifidobacterium]TPF87412.1 integrase [Bifidobacterium sp. UTCIF-37]TPF91188.1 integrase [Bifidobacterium sp. UTCIF-38]
MASVTKYTTSKGETRYRVRYRKPDGSQTDRRGFRRKVDAENWAAEHVTVAKARGTFIDPQAGRARVASLWPAWIAAKRVRVKASYLESLEREWRVRVEPQWGGREVASITHAEIQAWVADLHAGETDADGNVTRKGSSSTVVLRAEGILSGLLEQAVRDRLIPANPCRDLELPRKQRREHRYLTCAELLRLADAAGDRRTIVLVLGLTGLRWGEMAGLRVGDVDLGRRRLSIRRSATEVKGKIVVDTPKSDRWRQVVFPAVLDAPLREACAGKSAGDLVFTGADGGYVRRTHGPNTTSSWFYWARKRAGIEGSMTVHDLRHTAASLMVHAGANVKAVQRQLGHATASMTLDVYADLFDDDLDAVGESMNSMLLESVGNMWAKEQGEAS